MKFQSNNNKLNIIVLTVIFPMILTALVVIFSYHQISNNVIDNKFNELNSLQNSKINELNNLFDSFSKLLISLSSQKMTIDAFEEFEKGFYSLKNDIKKPQKQLKEQLLNDLAFSYLNKVDYKLENGNKKRDLESYIPKSKDAIIAQYLYTIKSINPSNYTSNYIETHRTYHESYSQYLKAYNLYDIFFIDLQGNLIYSNIKEKDFGTNLLNGVYKNSALASVFKKALKRKKGEIAFEDFRPYEPSFNTSASFFSTPVYKDNKRIGVLAVQIATSYLNKIMQFNREYNKVGLGKTGDNYLIGIDFKLRSNPRFLLEEKLDYSKTYKNIVGHEKVITQITKSAVDGKNQSNKLQLIDRDGEEFLAVYSKVSLPSDTTWVLITKISSSEVLEDINSFLKQIVFITILVFNLSALLIILYINSIMNKLREKELYLEKISQNVIYSKTDLNGIITEVSDAFCQVSGYSKKDLIGKSHRVLKHPDMPKELFKNLWESLRNGETWRGEIKNKRKNGTEFWLASEMKPIKNLQTNEFDSYMSIRQDITDQKKAQNIENIISKMLIPIIIISKRDNTIIFANKYAEQQYEISMDKIIGMSAEQFFLHEEEYYKAIQNLKESATLEKEEGKFKTYTNETFDGLLSMIPIIFNSQECFIHMVTDISIQKELYYKLEMINKHTVDSINYASLIQKSIIPKDDNFKKIFNKSFVYWQPKDIVGGDIYFIERFRDSDEIMLYVIDCTGHGVHGAFVTMLVKAIQQQMSSLMRRKELKMDPAVCLQYFNINMKTLLKQHTKDSLSNAGFDGGVIYYSKEKNLLKFAGAHTPLFYTKDGKVNSIKGNRHSIGYNTSDPTYEFTTHSIEVSTGMRFYITTDGYLDQNGGEKSFPFGKKRFAKLLEEIQSLDFESQKEKLDFSINDYRGVEPYNDDITIIGFELS